MGKRILGLDLGTNSIGWGVVDDLGNGQFEVVKRGVHIFQEGVKIEKGNESSKASERTGYRSARRLKFRRKLRKIETLRVLSEAGYCPTLSEGELKGWQSKKIYPGNEAFRSWCKTCDPENGEGVFDNPYYDRWLAATEKLDLGKEEDRFKLGRAFYHMAQRRGFKSNRLDTTDESEGVVKADIDDLNEKMEGRTLGQYFWEECYGKGAIRGVHTSRDEHYLAEFDFICEKQGISDALKKALWQAIFYQRPLKSQKGLVACCPFEPRKKRAPISHPLFEEFRLLQTVNNIKLRHGPEDSWRSLTEEEKKTATSKFFRVSKAQFDFKDIGKALSKARNVGATFN
uniref:type II CRISPR RNA-guided endonuclease Cas9 n=1 Tax=Pontiella sp. TaxID=2837462 RepID=UPI0035627D09